MVSTSSSAGWPAASMARADLGDPAGHAGRGLVVDDADGLDLVGGVGGAAAPRSRSGSAPWRQSPGTNSTSRPEPRGHLPPERGEVAGLEREHPVAGRQRVDQRRLPGAGAGGRVDRPPGCVVPKTGFTASSTSRAEARRTPGPRWSMVGVVHGAQHPVRHVGRAGDLQEVSARGNASSSAGGAVSPGDPRAEDYDRHAERVSVARTRLSTLGHSAPAVDAAMSMTGPVASSHFRLRKDPPRHPRRLGEQRCPYSSS